MMRWAGYVALSRELFAREPEGKIHLGDLGSEDRITLR
jgi:hypothetical protein